MVAQADLFGHLGLPEGFGYQARLLAPAEEAALVGIIASLPFREFEFHGFFARRRVVAFGWRHDFNGGGLQKTEDIPAFLLPVRERAAGFAGLAPPRLQQVLLTEYRPGAAIGWHKDRSIFGEVVGVSLVSASTLRMRRRSPRGWQRAWLALEPRSVYLLRGPALTHWEHSIPAVDRLRYSITFRSFIEPPAVR